MTGKRNNVQLVGNKPGGIYPFSAQFLLYRFYHAFIASDCHQLRHQMVIYSYLFREIVRELTQYCFFNNFLHADFYQEYAIR